jgi:pantetheine-phosphate adenylyltransferase
MTQYKKVAVGGTFDKLHRGHKTLISKAFEVGENVVIGLSSDEFVARMGKPHRTAEYTNRKKELRKFLNEQGFKDRALIVPLKDPVGLMMSKDYDALVVSQDTAKIGLDINQKRLQAGIVPLKIITVALVPADNFCPISTTRIRKGEIDRNGHLLTKTAN